MRDIFHTGNSFFYYHLKKINREYQKFVVISHFIPLFDHMMPASKSSEVSQMRQNETLASTRVARMRDEQTRSALLLRLCALTLAHRWSIAARRPTDILLIVLFLSASYHD